MYKNMWLSNYYDLKHQSKSENKKHIPIYSSSIFKILGNYRIYRY